VKTVSHPEEWLYCCGFESHPDYKINVYKKSMKKLLLFLTLFCSLNIFSQNQPLVLQKYTTQHILRLEYPTSYLKVTVGSRLNDKSYLDFDENTMNDPFGFGAYDIKMKIFATPKIDYVQRVFITGLTKPIYFFSVGVIRKF